MRIHIHPPDSAHKVVEVVHRCDVVVMRFKLNVWVDLPENEHQCPFALVRLHNDKNTALLRACDSHPDFLPPDRLCKITVFFAHANQTTDNLPLLTAGF